MSHEEVSKIRNVNVDLWTRWMQMLDINANQAQLRENHQVLTLEENKTKLCASFRSLYNVERQLQMFSISWLLPSNESVTQPGRAVTSSLEIVSRNQQAAAVASFYSWLCVLTHTWLRYLNQQNFQNFCIYMNIKGEFWSGAFDSKRLNSCSWLPITAIEATRVEL